MVSEEFLYSHWDEKSFWKQKVGISVPNIGYIDRDDRSPDWMVWLLTYKY